MSGGVSIGRTAVSAFLGALVSASAHGVWTGAPWGIARGAAPEGTGAKVVGAAELPRLLTAIRPEYPEGAEGSAVVRLEVVVGIDGVAQSVRVVDGQAPFATAAMAAAATARFAPARKAGQPVAARFLLEVHVAPSVTPSPSARAQPPAAPAASPALATSAVASVASVAPVAPVASVASAPAAPLVASVASAPAAPSVASAPPVTSSAPVAARASRAAGASGGATAREATPIDVHVDGDRAPLSSGAPGATHVSRAAAARMPGAFGDTFRAVESLPGVAPYLSGLPYFFVRGATPTTTGYLLDGVTVPLLFHVGGGPAVIASSMIAGVDFHPGGYPASFGRQTGGFVSARSATPPARFSVDATLRLVDASALVTAPLPDERGVVFAAGRVSFTQAVLPLITPDLSLGYWDYQAGASYRLTANDRVRLLAFGADDFLAQQIAGVYQPIYKAQFHRVDLAYERGPEEAPRARASGSLFGEVDAGEEGVAAPSRARVRVAATVGVDRSHLVGQGDLSTLLGQVRASADVPLHRMLRVRAGADLLTEERGLDPSPAIERPPGDDGSFAATFADRAVGTFGAFADLSFTPRPFVEIVAGLRADFFGDPNGGAVGVDPRVAARVALLPWLASITTFGMAHQRPSFVLPLPGVAPAGSELVLQEALHASQGLEVRLPLRVLLQATGYFHEHENLTDYMATCWRQEDECRFFARAAGRSYGLEVLVQRSLTERLGAQLAYTLSRSERTVQGETFAADTDRTHVVHLVLGYEPLPGLHAGARITAYSGRPFTLAAGKRNVARGPGFFRLDLRVSKTWRLGGTAHVTAAIEGLNVTLAKEMVDVDCRSPVELGLACGRQEIGPITIPSVGLSGGF